MANSYRCPLAALEVEWYQRTGIFPIHGLIVIRNAQRSRSTPGCGEPLRAQASKELHLQRLAEAVHG